MQGLEELEGGWFGLEYIQSTWSESLEEPSISMKYIAWHTKPNIKIYFYIIVWFKFFKIAEKRTAIPHYMI